MNKTALTQLLNLRNSFLVMVALLLSLTAYEVSAQGPSEESQKSVDLTKIAHVTVDARWVLRVRGVSAYPADERAEMVRTQIIDAARDKSFNVENLVVVDEDDRTLIFAGEKILLSVFDMDAEIENLDRRLLAEVVKSKVGETIENYRHDRGTDVLLTRAAYALALTVLLAFLFWGIRRLFSRLDKWAVAHVQTSLKDIASKSHQLIQADQIWTLVAGFLGALRVLTLVVLVYSYLNTVLGLFPWTRQTALVLLELVMNPVRSLWTGFLNELPDIVFLVVLFLVLRYVLKLIRLFFNGVRRGRIKLRDFDPDWALPTHRIVRFLVVAFAIVIAYPYIPGSDSLAFKGVSVFIGVIFSLGSSSFIGNVVAGLAMTYRGAFKEGDLVKIDDVFGEVREIKLMTTRIRTLKNERVVIPNSNILNTNVVNYSVMVTDNGLVLHTTVGIGYDVPWRQVEAMLLLAADRTPGLQKEPGPFVLQNLMGDFAVNYEINAYCDDAGRMVAIKSSLHSNIQDVFNEHGVQIMSPAYVSDPKNAKIVSPEDWFASPAIKTESEDDV